MHELEVRHVRMPLHDTLPAVALLCPRGRPDLPALPFPIGASAAEAMLGELRGCRRGRAAATWLTRFAAGLGHGLVVRLVPAEPGLPATERSARAQCGLPEVTLEPGEALVAAVRLGLRLLGDPSLFADRERPEPPRVAACLTTLELDPSR